MQRVIDGSMITGYNFTFSIFSLAGEIFELKVSDAQ